MWIHVGVCGIGFGHSSRSLTIIKKLLEKGYEVSVSTYGEAVRFFLRNGIPANNVTAVKYGVSENGSVSIKRTLAENVMLPLAFAKQVLEEYSIIGNGVDVVVSDTRASSVLAGKMARKPVMVILNQFNIALETEKHKKIAKFFEPFAQVPAKVWELADAIIIPDLPPPYTISLRTLNLPKELDGKTTYVGPLMDKPPHADRIKIREKLGIGEDELLVLAHISGPKKEREALIKKIISLVKNANNSYRFVVTMGNPEGRNVIRERNVIVFDWYEDIHELFTACDVIIARAGLSVIQTCILHGKRMLLIPIPQHGEQVGNAYRVKQLGIGDVIEEQNLSEKTIRDALRNLTESGMFDRNMASIKNLAESLGGVEKVIEIIDKLLSSF